MILSRCSYASGVSTSSSPARAAAIVSGFPLKVPTWNTVSLSTIDITSSVAPIAPDGSPAPSVLASVTMSGWTPKRSVAPPAAIASPVFTSSKMSTTSCCLVISRTASR